MQIVAERSQAITGADGAMVNLIDGDMLHTRAVSGIAGAVFDTRRPLESSVAKYAIESGLALLIEDAPNDPRVNQKLRAAVGDTSLVCVPLFRGGEVIGTLNVMSRSETTRLNEDNRQTLEMLSVVLSAAVSHAAEFEARRGQAEALARFRTLFEGVSIGILRLGRDGRAVEANPALEQMLGYTAAEFGEMIMRDYIHPEDFQRAEELFRTLMLGEREAFRLEARYSRKDGVLVWGQVSAVLERDQDGRPAFAVTMIENITKRKRAEVELVRQAELSERQALHDPLTGLPNRLLFDDRIERAISQAERDGTRLAIVMLDLDRFKEVNDSLGHRAGDELLEEFGVRLQGALRASDTAARLGGDEFGLLLPQSPENDGLLATIERVRAALEQPILVQELPLSVEASIGIAIFPDHGHSAELLIQRADVAMYSAKRENAPFYFYEIGTDEGDDSTPRGRGRAPPCPGRARAGAALPAQGGARGRRGAVGRGARALGASDARHDLSGRLHPGGAGDEPDPAAHAVRAGRGVAPVPGLARRGPRDRGLGEPLDAQPARSRASRPGRRAALPLEARARSPAPGTHRVGDARQPEADDRRARRAVGARSQALRSTTSARDTRRSRTCATCRSTRSRSTARSSPAWAWTERTTPSSAPRSISGSTSASPSWRRAWRRRRYGTSSERWAAPRPRATSSARLCRPRS